MTGDMFFIVTNVFLTVLQFSAGTHFAAPEAKSSNSQRTNLLDCFYWIYLAGLISLRHLNHP